MVLTKHITWCFRQVPTLAPTFLPVSITVQIPRRQAGIANLIGSQTSLLLYSPTSGNAYNWSTANTTLATTTCLMTAGPYLGVPGSCLSPGRTYTFTLRVANGSTYGLAKVRKRNDQDTTICVQPLLGYGMFMH
jgi:hypothetical protein